MSDLVRDPTDELVVFSVPPPVMTLPSDLRDDYCYWPMISVILSQAVVPLGPVRDVSYQYMTHVDDGPGIEMRHPCAQCRHAISEAAATLQGAEPGALTICVAQCVVVYLRDITWLSGTFSPILRPSGGG